MKLPDFLALPELNALRSRMGIAPDKLGNLATEGIRHTLTDDELKKITSIGIDVDIDDVEFRSDGTLGYKGRRVLLYIRDWNNYGGRDSEPKFHISGCETLSYMKRVKRFQRYVVASKADGMFDVNVRKNGRITRGPRRLDVCQTCLANLAFEGFRMDDLRSKRVAFVKSFELNRFFDAYPVSLHAEEPNHFSDTAPEDDYAPDFSPRSQKLREAARWTCEECSTRLAGQDERKYLHVHHIDGSKWNDSPTNLRVLCIACHARQPLHGHMKSLPDYVGFLRRPRSR